MGPDSEGEAMIQDQQQSRPVQCASVALPEEINKLDEMTLFEMAKLGMARHPLKRKAPATRDQVHTETSCHVSLVLMSVCFRRQIYPRHDCVYDIHSTTFAVCCMNRSSCGS